ncbi:C10 family peptidase [Alistipes putredinis]|uniref:C10 family peptidase n=1 Tax=Alistipes putredinis TaxID=28117 RepID=UPI00243242F6|nr:C10 family peptidase [Alistipes putredinis]MBS6652203.1 C10 family peptidase [Alistipes putredinis]
MKHFGLFSLFFGFWLLVGCTADPGAEPGPPGENPPAAENPHAVPVEQALEELQSVLKEIDTPTEDGAATRSGGIRRVKSVTTVSPEALNPGGTRSETTTDVEELLYIVNFENEAGYAILGADDRLEPVYAVVDEGSLTTEDFRYAVTVTPEQAEADGELVFPLQIIAQAAANGIGGPVTDIGTQGPEGWKPLPTLIRTETGPVTNYHHLPPQIPINLKLHQGYPCNALCPVKNGTRCKAGCTAIAIAQVLIANYINNNSIVGSIQETPINWSLIQKAIEKPSLLAPREESEPIGKEALEVARLIREVGRLMHLDYGTTSSSGRNGRIQGVLEYVLYSGVHDWTYQFSKVKQMLFERKKTTIVCGSNTVGTKKNHAFNLDGWLERSRTVTKYYSDNSKIVSTHSSDLIHCNFGWKWGTANGYYYYGAFDLRNGPVIGSEPDATTSTSDTYYDMDLIVTYTNCP